MANVVFIKPYLETDATWEMIRTSSYLGLWYMASKLKARGHNVKYLDEVMRNNGIKKTSLFETTLEGNDYLEHPLDMNIEDYRAEKNKYFENNTPKQFVDKYTAFHGNKIKKSNCHKLGNSIEDTLQEIEKFNPDFVCISLIATANLNAAIRLGKAVKINFPKAKIIYGGQHVSSLYKSFVGRKPMG